jgi:hypothetical protein
VEERASEFAQKPLGSNAVPPIPGGGLARRIFASLNDPSDGERGASNDTAWSVPMIGILHFVFEGDNRGDAGMLLAIVNRALDLKIQGTCGYLSELHSEGDRYPNSRERASQLERAVWTRSRRKLVWMKVTR